MPAAARVHVLRERIEFEPVCEQRRGRKDGEGERLGSCASRQIEIRARSRLVSGSLIRQSEHMSAFRMGRLDHVHIRVPDRAEAARWYAEHLGFEPVEAFDFWATGFEGGPLQISADGGRTTLALFEASEGHPLVPQENGVAFSVDAGSFIAFARSLPCGIDNPDGDPLTVTDLVDFDMCWAFNLVDPWGNQYELNCYEYDRIKAELVEADGVNAVRYWPRELYAQYRDRASR